ncbi:hypothetical protein [Micromonospora okii]|uniref:hypothetical protein n=1 Tax=Micromonospora okii TaxID=1182970 RepID=UPI001E31EB84|nr:hypothetical protein [Micromonospora okii]
MTWEWLGPVVTAVVGIAGVAGTVWTAYSGRRHQIELTKAQGMINISVSLSAEKRLVHARFLQRADTAFEEAQTLVFEGGAMTLEDSPTPPNPPGVTTMGLYKSGTPFALAMTELDNSQKGGHHGRASDRKPGSGRTFGYRRVRDEFGRRVGRQPGFGRDCDDDARGCGGACLARAVARVGVREGREEGRPRWADSGQPRVTHGTRGEKRLFSDGDRPKIADAL